MEAMTGRETRVEKVGYQRPHGPLIAMPAQLSVREEVGYPKQNDELGEDRYCEPLWAR